MPSKVPTFDRHNAIDYAMTPSFHPRVLPFSDARLKRTYPLSLYDLPLFSPLLQPPTMHLTLLRKNSLHLPIQRPPLSDRALDVHTCMISCDVSSPDAPSSWLVICPPAQPISINSTIHLHLESGQASHIFASVEYVSFLDKHAIEFAISFPVASATHSDPRRAWAYLSVLKEWALLPPVLSSIHQLLYDVLPESLPRLAEGHVPDPITPWMSPCIHIRREKCEVRPQPSAVSQKRRKEYFTAYICLIGHPPSPPPPLPMQPLRVSLPARPQYAARSMHLKRATSPMARPMRMAHPTDETILARPLQVARRAF